MKVSKSDERLDAYLCAAGRFLAVPPADLALFVEVANNACRRNFEGVSAIASRIADITYRVETVTFPSATAVVQTYASADEVVHLVRAFRPGDRVVFVAALDMDAGVDYGNFYLFMNSAGSAHVMLHEHREFLPRDPAAARSDGEVKFLDEEGEEFFVPAYLTTTHQRGIAALEYWLPRQERWPELKWD